MARGCGVNTSTEYIHTYTHTCHDIRTCYALYAMLWCGAGCAYKQTCSLWRRQDSLDFRTLQLQHPPPPSNWPREDRQKGCASSQMPNGHVCGQVISYSALGLLPVPFLPVPPPTAAKCLLSICPAPLNPREAAVAVVTVYIRICPSFCLVSIPHPDKGRYLANGAPTPVKTLT